jgi:uncharacterized tellurite resistance protein B-like protein
MDTEEQKLWTKLIDYYSGKVLLDCDYYLTKEDLRYYAHQLLEAQGIEKDYEDQTYSTERLETIIEQNATIGADELEDIRRMFLNKIRKDTITIMKGLIDLQKKITKDEREAVIRKLPKDLTIREKTQKL